jgi:trans-aconitate 2-methyltransferase
LKVVDLGCGTGELTRRLADALPGSDVLGIDRSSAMLANATQYARERLRFAEGDIAGLEGQYDLIFSNAALQWLDNHEHLFPWLWSHLRPGGQLAAQLPANHDHPSHRLALELATSEPFRQFFPEGGRDSPVLPPEAYAQMLFDLGGTEITAMLKVYSHVLEDADAILEWVKGTLLTFYLERLPKPYRAQFVERYHHELRRRFRQKPVFYGFKRILLSALRR